MEENQVHERCDTSIQVDELKPIKSCVCFCSQIWKPYVYFIHQIEQKKCTPKDHKTIRNNIKLPPRAKSLKKGRSSPPSFHQFSCGMYEHNFERIKRHRVYVRGRGWSVYRTFKWRLHSCQQHTTTRITHPWWLLTSSSNDH
jgi:hypothetical protein